MAMVVLNHRKGSINGGMELSAAGEDLDRCHQPDIVMKVPVKGVQEPVGLLKNGADLDARRPGHCSLFCH